MIRRSLVSLILSLFLCLTVTTVPVSAQEWRQEVQVITSIEYGDPMYLFLDSLTSVLDRHPEVRVRRTEQDTKTVPYEVLREQLHEEGVDLLSATHAFIQYRFDLGARSRMVETVQDIYFIFRVDESETDVPILHVSSRDPVIADLLTESGVASAVNMKAVTPFRQLMAFPHIISDPNTAIVELSGRPVRDGFIHEQDQFRQILTEHTIVNGGAYVLDTSDRRVAMIESNP